MLKLPRLELSIVIIFLCPLAHAENTTNKCTDGKQVTYANMPCEKLGLNSVGPVKNAVTIIPAPPKPKKPPPENYTNERSEKDDVTQSDATDDEAPSTTKIKPINPLIEKLLQ